MLRRWVLPLVLSLLGHAAGARTLQVGPDQPFPSPSFAAKVAQDGDIVLIEPGEYYDCAIWTQSELLIAGTGPGVVITDATCQGKALFVLTGNNTTIRDLTLARARVADGNGAGIRLEGQGLTAQHVRFINNQVGLLSGASAASIRLSECRFEAGGAGGPRPTFAVLVGAASLLRIEASIFKRVQGGQINSSAAMTELINNEIETGTGNDPAVAVISAQGRLVMQDNLLRVGPNAPRPVAAVLVTAPDAAELHHNRMQNTTGRPMTMLLDWSGAAPALDSNEVGPGDTELSSGGLWWHRAALLYRGVTGAARAFAAEIRHGLHGRFVPAAAQGAPPG